ncbi:hypothetical protein F5Y05DRAFT_406985 [Hypoxylon sp. FL0543]|nr:hypothetical protein F5Y05DRAFT_406985 [Hypoxylon sp. FL0543]
MCPTTFSTMTGFLLTSGVFQSYYELYLITGYSSSETAWISTACAFFLLASGIVTGPLYDFGLYKPLLAVRSIAFVAFALYLLSYTVLKNPLQKQSIVRRNFDLSAFTDVPFMMLSIASLLSATAFYIPLLYLSLFSEVRVPNIDLNLTLNLLPILNGASVVGRLVAGFVAAIFGPTETILVCLVLGFVLLSSYNPSGYETLNRIHG